MPDTLPELLARAAERYPDKGIGIFDGRGRASGRRSYPELLAAAREIAARLAQSVLTFATTRLRTSVEQHI